ncbi:hypothetical protein Tco_1341735, partial [Tanacetum coccineum]
MTLHEVSVETRACNLHIPLVIPVRTVACFSISEVSLKSLINHSLDRFWSHVVWVGVASRGILSSSGRRCDDLSRSQKTKRELSSAALNVLTTRPTCHSSLASCLSSLGESLPSMHDAYAVVVPDVPGYGSRVHTHDYSGSEAVDRSPDSILSSEPKPLGKHRPPPPQS